MIPLSLELLGLESLQFWAQDPASTEPLSVDEFTSSPGGCNIEKVTRLQVVVHTVHTVHTQTSFDFHTPWPVKSDFASANTANVKPQCKKMQYIETKNKSFNPESQNFRINIYSDRIT